MNTESPALVSDAGLLCVSATVARPDAHVWFLRRSNQTWASECPHRRTGITKIQKTMWCFIVKQREMTAGQYRDLQKIAGQTEVELFSEPYENLCLFNVERPKYTAFVDYADLNGVQYNAYSERPTRDELLAEQRG